MKLIMYRPSGKGIKHGLKKDDRVLYFDNHLVWFKRCDSGYITSIGDVFEFKGKSYTKPDSMWKHISREIKFSELILNSESIFYDQLYIDMMKKLGFDMTGYQPEGNVSVDYSEIIQLKIISCTQCPKIKKSKIRNVNSYKFVCTVTNEVINVGNKCANRIPEWCTLKI